MIFTTIYRLTGRIYYYRFIRQIDGYIWNSSTEKVVEILTWVDSVINMTEVTGTGQYPISIPTNLPTGVIYDVIVYRRAGASPVNTDIVDVGFVLKRGSSFGF